MEQQQCVLLIVFIVSMWLINKCSLNNTNNFMMHHIRRSAASRVAVGGGPPPPHTCTVALQMEHQVDLIRLSLIIRRRVSDSRVDRVLTTNKPLQSSSGGELRPPSLADLCSHSEANVGVKHSGPNELVGFLHPKNMVNITPAKH